VPPNRAFSQQKIFFWILAQQKQNEGKVKKTKDGWDIDSGERVERNVFF